MPPRTLSCWTLDPVPPARDPAHPAQVRALVGAALTVAMQAVADNRAMHKGLSAALEASERMDGEALKGWLGGVQVGGRGGTGGRGHWRQEGWAGGI